MVIMFESGGTNGGNFRTKTKECKTISNTRQPSTLTSTYLVQHASLQHIQTASIKVLFTLMTAATIKITTLKKKKQGVRQGVRTRVFVPGC
jgi:hypothetical protein